MGTVSSSSTNSAFLSSLTHTNIPKKIPRKKSLIFIKKYYRNLNTGEGGKVK